MKYLMTNLWNIFSKKYHNPFYLIQLKNAHKIPSVHAKHNYFKNSFFASVILELNTLDINIRISTSMNIFKKSLLCFTTPSPSSLFNCHDPKGIKYVQGYPKYICHCGCKIETATHFLLRCPQFPILLKHINHISYKDLSLNKNSLV